MPFIVLGPLGHGSWCLFSRTEGTPLPSGCDPDEGGHKQLNRSEFTPKRLQILVDLTCKWSKRLDALNNRQWRRKETNFLKILSTRELRLLLPSNWDVYYKCLFRVVPKRYPCWVCLRHYLKELYHRIVSFDKNSFQPNSGFPCSGFYKNAMHFNCN